MKITFWPNEFLAWSGFERDAQKSESTGYLLIKFKKICSHQMANGNSVPSNCFIFLFSHFINRSSRGKRFWYFRVRTTSSERLQTLEFRAFPSKIRQSKRNSLLPNCVFILAAIASHLPSLSLYNDYRLKFFSSKSSFFVYIFIVWQFFVVY